jgi:thioredoxin 1
MSKPSNLRLGLSTALAALAVFEGTAALAQDAMMKKDSMAKQEAMMSPRFVAYSDAAFTAAQKAKQPIIVAISALWCPVCKNQEIILSKLMKDPAYAKTAFFKVDFDSQKAAVGKFKAKSQSTLIAFRGGTEVSRIFYTADAGKVTELAAQASAR